VRLMAASRLAGALLISWSASLAQTGADTERIRLVYADSLVGLSIDGKAANKLSGRVQLVQGAAFLNCHEAFWFEKEDRAILVGDVVVYDGNRTLKADRVEIDGPMRTETATGNAVLESGRRRIFARTMAYRQTEERALAEGSVRVEDLIENAVLKCGRALYDRRTEYARAEDQPVLVKEDTASKKTWAISGRVIEAWGNEQRAVVSDSVAISRDNLQGRCGKAEALAKPDRFVLTVKPVVRQGTRLLSGDSITVWVDGPHFNGALLVGRAEIVTEDSSGTDRLTGERITIEARQDTVRRVVVESRAESRYRVFDDQNVFEGVNAVSGDRIELVFERDKLERVTVSSRPGLCTGIYTPAKKSQIQ